MSESNSEHKILKVTETSEGKYFYFYRYLVLGEKGERWVRYEEASDFATKQAAEDFIRKLEKENFIDPLNEALYPVQSDLSEMELTDYLEHDTYETEHQQ